VKALREFIEAGGTLVCLNRASDFAIEQFKLPVRDVVDGLPRTDFYVPGSILRIELDTNDPIAKGMPKESIAWAENSPVFEVLGSSSPLSMREGIEGRGPYGAQSPHPNPLPKGEGASCESHRLVCERQRSSALRLAARRRSHQRQSRAG